MEAITVHVDINQAIEQVWKLWNNAEDIRQWNMISEEWFTPFAENNLKEGGKLSLIMGLKDGSFSFDFIATYDEIKNGELIRYTQSDGRRSTIRFEGSNPVKLSETFEPNSQDSVAMQQDFCQAILNSFKKYAEEVNMPNED